MVNEQKGKKNVYLTGSSGFLGGYIARELQKDPSVAKIYCPVRTKKGQSGPQRLKQLFPGYDKCVHVAPEDRLPADTNYVLLNAYSTRFDESIKHKLQENVVPILRILDECQQEPHKSTVKGITFVSTAYVQPPEPFRRVEGNRLPFLLGESECTLSPFQLYHQIMKHEDPDLMMTEIVPDIHQYYNFNAYTFSKHLLEHMIGEKYHNLPITIVRPSMIGPPVSLDYGMETKSAVPLMLNLSTHYIVLAPDSRGCPNVVLINDVCRDVLNGCFELAKPATRIGNKNWHTIVSATGLGNVGFRKYCEVGTHVPRMHADQAWVRNIVRSLEYAVAYVFYGSKACKLLHAVYDNYDFFCAQTWDFEPRYMDDFVDIIIKNKERYYSKLKKQEAILTMNSNILTQRWFWYLVFGSAIVFLLRLLFEEVVVMQQKKFMTS